MLFQRQGAKLPPQGAHGAHPQSRLFQGEFSFIANKTLLSFMEVTFYGDVLAPSAAKSGLIDDGNLSSTSAPYAGWFPTQSTQDHLPNYMIVGHANVHVFLLD